MTTENFIKQTYDKIKAAVMAFSDEDTDDIYVISFYKSNISDDLRLPMLTVGYNTVTNWKLSAPGEAPSYQEEAKWNYAFWLQNEELNIGGDEDDAFDAWVKTLPFYYSDEEEEADYDEAFEKGVKIQETFMHIVVSLSRRLHEDGVIRKKFGRDVPVIIHELEYYDEPVAWTMKGNPDGLADEFEEWVMAQ
ncbi:hypothetical protein MKQ68_05495 [Chitinophaga horti]|uniref:DUF4303 domain-containing protein n=1 Tax=Chitinophaga horti TaxID=2920382 RepID=A0ABY6J8D7_9BACT|nr:hypothetical protein [Chitinophaga horti]UYQ94544.1 hypothetical protein MKQ68_05495 [Chitinophaga horti]